MMLRKRRNLFWIGLALGLALAAGGYGIFSLANEAAGADFLPENEQPVAQSGPVGLRFRQAVDPASVEAHLRFEPEVKGRWRWEGNTAWFDPQAAFTAGQDYTLSLEAGAVSPDGGKLPGERWRFTVRAAWVAYISPADGGREVWRAAVDGALPQQVTRTGGQVVDFSVSRDGESIYYSAANDSGGADVWRVDRGGQHPTRLVECGQAWCDGGVAAPDGSYLAYSQRLQAQAKPVPWVYNLENGHHAPLYADTLIQGETFRWAPDGQKLAFCDLNAGAVRVYDFQTARDTLFESNLPGPVSWSPDGQKLNFLSEDRGSGFTRVVLFQADLEKQDLQPVWSDVVGDDSGLPVWSPEGDVLLLSQRILAGSASRQLFTIHPDGSGLTEITHDLRYTNAAYTFSPDGQMVVFQRLAFGSSDNRSEVVLWDRRTGQITVLALNAAHPVWLP